MKLYVVVGVFMALLYPLAAAFMWGADITRAVFWWWGGAFLSVAMGAVSSYTLWTMQNLSRYVAVSWRPMFIRLLGAELVAFFSVILLEVMSQLLSGISLNPFSFGFFLTLQTPAFIAAFIAYHSVGLLVKSVVPQADTKPRKRK